MKQKKLSPEALKVVMAAMAFSAHGPKGRRLRNAAQRAKGVEPAPDIYAGLKRHARYSARTISTLKVEPHVHPRHKRVPA